MSELSRFRAEIDDFLEFHPQSPLSEEQREQFQGLDYFPEDPDYVYRVRLERFPEEPPLEMETSTGDVERFRRFGRFTFDVEGEQASLVIYQNLYGGDFFLPFKDATNGRESYGAGRYLDDHRPGLQHLDEEHFEVDFNYAYNPYCAYSERYSCPLPPAENWLDVPIRAGEKKFE